MFGFPSHSRTTYNTNFLRELTLVVKFSKTPELLTKRDELIKIFAPYFPNCANVMTNTLPIGNIGNAQPVATSSLSGFQFTTKDSFKKLNITSESISISHNGQAYSNFEVFWEESNQLIKTILDLSSIKVINHTALRKINIIQLRVDGPNYPYEGLGTVFNSALVNQYLTIPSNSLLVSGFSNFILKGEGKNLKVVYGLLPPNPRVEIKEKEMVLDIDLFCDKQHLSFEELKGKFAEINQEIFNIFHWSLLDKTINHLNVNG
ncbi:MAG: hypothetical protein K0S53_677 [Bacteroidetes bacterium]|jgi:uncharacterized protein (TIGR04255 family)|nr:hypothetical protein [Bacteroidota bacterium]